MKINIIELMGKIQAQTGKKLDQKTLAEETGLSRQTINAWVNGRVDSYKGEIIVTLCRYFNCDVGDLMSIIDVPESQN